MRTYYLFWIKDEFYHAYFKNPDSLYKTLQNLYGGKVSSLSLAASLYKQICELHKIDILSSYLEGVSYKHRQNSYLLIQSKTNEKTFITVRPSVILLKSNKNVPHIFKIFPYYSSHLFVCDFENNDYFWLTNQYYKKHVK